MSLRKEYEVNSHYVSRELVDLRSVQERLDDYLDRVLSIAEKNQKQIEQLEKTNKDLLQRIALFSSDFERLENQIQCSHELTIEYTFENGDRIWGHFVCDICDFETERKLTAAEVKAAKTLNL